MTGLAKDGRPDHHLKVSVYVAHRSGEMRRLSEDGRDVQDRRQSLQQRLQALLRPVADLWRSPSAPRAIPSAQPWPTFGFDRRTPNARGPQKGSDECPRGRQVWVAPLERLIGITLPVEVTGTRLANSPHRTPRWSIFRLLLVRQKFGLYA